MKKIGLIAMVFLLAGSLCACRRQEKPAPTQPQVTTPPATVAPTIIPEMDPTLDTNIPDPTVNENSQGMGSNTEDSESNIGTENNDIGTDNSMNGLDNATRNRMFRK